MECIVLQYQFLYYFCLNAKSNMGIMKTFFVNSQHHQHQYYSTGLLSNYDKYHDHQKHFLGPKKKIAKEQRKQEKKLKGNGVQHVQVQ